jgi:putative polyketide hydroxylase
MAVDARMRTEDAAVLVVGAGPAGLTAATTLSRYGVPVLVVERRAEPSTLPRATGVSLRTMELLRSWGLEAEIRGGGVDVEWRMWFCETLARAAEGQGRPVGFPTRDQCDVLSPTTPACVPQDHLEAVLLRHLAEPASARIERGVEVVAIDDRADGVRAELRDTRTGARRTVRARYAIGADGIHSTVRTALGIPVRGEDHLHEGVTVVFRAPLWDVVGVHRYGIYWIEHPEADGSLLPAGTGDRWVYGKSWDPARERLAEDYTAERVARLIRLATGVPRLDPVVERIGATTFAALIADSFRGASTFLLGDAAHRVSPRGGTGMNTAVADAFDLGWKLAWVLRGWAGPALLDSYEPERRPIVEHNVARSADPDGSIRPVGEEVPADLGGRLPHLWLPGAARRSTLDLLGPGLTVFSSTRTDLDACVPESRVPVDVRVLDPFTARALGIRGRDALVCRPDGVPLRWCGAAAPARAASARRSSERGRTWVPVPAVTNTAVACGQTFDVRRT